ncbi:MAG: hypothetical protein Tp156SUR915002_43 [Prokaryotic dsDNA virus sp.]|jgi:DNA mismatch repair protein MutH|nr:MAG: hypothetical protein Tp162SUR384061_52 [Prokaryotic dsDNA virus sp.]QDP59782.1 MAG: hypothetical protein Tp156SUR915002_43 [Prokaryotic dsDNA virus sp.]|tara:strand:- start:6771 stop:6974 length:204 start_codon:yes stop_codon:yes gene_type:complete
MNFIVKIGFDTEKERFEVGDPISKEQLKEKDWKELLEMGVIGKKDPVKELKKEVKKVKTKQEKSKEL